MIGFIPSSFSALAQYGIPQIKPHNWELAAEHAQDPYHAHKIGGILPVVF